MAENKQDKYKTPVTAILTGITDLFRRTRPDCFLLPADRLDGKTVLIDGASSGLGFAIAVDAARRGAKVIMACRSGIPEKGEKVKKLSGNDNVHMELIDFRDLSGIRHPLYWKSLPPSIFTSATPQSFRAKAVRPFRGWKRCSW